MPRGGVLSSLVYHADLDYYECSGCEQDIEVPQFAVFQGSPRLVPVKYDPENRVMWREEIEREHSNCHKPATRLIQ